MSRPLLLSIAAALTVGTILIATVAPPHLADTPTKTASGNTAQALIARHENRRISQLPRHALENPGELPASLAGSSHGVMLRLDTRGNLVIDDGLIRIFDFYLSALGDEDISHILIRIHRDLSDQLAEPALTQARDILQRYADYRIALEGIDESPSGKDETSYLKALGNRLDQVRRLRQSYFSRTEISAFFGLDDAEDDYMSKKLEIAHGTQLSPSEKQRHIEALDRELPEDLRTLRKRVTQDSDVYFDTVKMKADGAPLETIYQFRARELGEAAARNLARLDEEQEQWMRRLQAYSGQRQQLLKSGLSTQDQQRYLQEFLEKNFDALEQKRVIALQDEP